MTSPNITPITNTATQSLPEQPQPAPRWTPAKQKTFLEALARCGSVKSAATYAGMSRESAHRLRRRVGNEAFARAWDAALIHARELYAEELLEKGLHGWTETVWYHGEEVGERSRFSPHLLLSALGRLDKKAEGLDLAGHPARAAAGDFDAMLEAIGEGEDCTEMLAEQDRTAEPEQLNYGLQGPDNAVLMDQLKSQHERERINATAPEDVDISDLDPLEAESWDDLQWLRAERSGMMDEPDFWAKVEAGNAGKDDPDGPGLYSV